MYCSDCLIPACSSATVICHIAMFHDALEPPALSTLHMAEMCLNVNTGCTGCFWIWLFQCLLSAHLNTTPAPLPSSEEL